MIRGLACDYIIIDDLEYNPKIKKLSRKQKKERKKKLSFWYDKTLQRTIVSNQNSN